MPSTRPFDLHTSKKRQLNQAPHPRNRLGLLDKILPPPTQDEPQSGVWGSSPIETYFELPLDSEDS